MDDGKSINALHKSVWEKDNNRRDVWVGLGTHSVERQGTKCGVAIEAVKRNLCASFHLIESSLIGAKLHTKFERGYYMSGNSKKVARYKFLFP
jgi:hypothetical protein